TIPYTNQDGTNRTVESENALNLTVLRNGEPESVSNVVKNNGYYTVYIGSASSYVHGEQVYTLEYDYTDVITEFDADGNNVSGKEGVEKLLQELYWDTNGTGWNQSFEHLTANLHTTKDIYKNMDTTAWCYVGSYGEKGQDKCTITPTSDGFSFTTGYLEERENLTFVVQFKPDSFYVLLEKNYILVILLSIEIAIMAFLIIRRIIKWRKCGKDMKVLYKSLFTTPQYQPPEDTCICTAEGEQIYLQKTKSSYVATLLELAVSKKITVKKVENERKYDWAVILNVEPDELTGPQKQMMNILSGNGGLAKGDEIPIKKHTATRYLANCAERYKDDAVDTLKRRSYLREDDTKETSTIRFLLTYILIFFFVIPIAVMLLVREGETTLMLNAEIVGEKVIPAVFVIILIVGIVVLGILNGQIRKYSKYTESGIKLAKYLEGLELYIKMAEADRLKFLQSVEGADTSEAGIVKLYERLLPWASLFGAEESWVKELAKYYEVGNVDEAISSDVLHGIIAANIAHDVSRAITSSTNYHEPSSSGGSWSSSSSGGGSFSSGGGGFSGGGGGGGGGGGW
ncbi:MAG: DUF2207 domain-containing protein, partial [Candidatus Saccharimonadaceae bacterium]|nr:DUF2207 domain-containing protein [Candidatus Saccharimonadaceae bacterium]